jgi:hypothetical protein
MNQKIVDLFKDFKLLNSDIPVLSGKLPDEIIEEIQKFVDVSRKTKEHKLSFLVEHHNQGLNDYQISIPTKLIENSFTQAFVIYLGEYFESILSKQPIEYFNRSFVLRKNEGHFDGCDFWINFSYLNSSNPIHNHPGYFSGVIYFNNANEEPTIFENGLQYFGKSGEIIIFPSSFGHYVETKTTNSERITFSFNLNRIT